MDTSPKLKHLEFIQAVIARLASNSMLMKGWGVSVIVALIALGAAKDGGAKLALLSLLPMAAFAYLDAYYLNLERNFRKLYDKFRQSNNDEQFDMELNSISDQEKLVETFRRPTVWAFWLAALVATVSAFCVLK